MFGIIHDTTYISKSHIQSISENKYTPNDANLLQTDCEFGEYGTIIIAYINLGAKIPFFINANKILGNVGYEQFDISIVKSELETLEINP